jgi:hypothetical protein
MKENFVGKFPYDELNMIFNTSKVWIYVKIMSLSDINPSFSVFILYLTEKINNKICGVEMSHTNKTFGRIT